MAAIPLLRRARSDDDRHLRLVQPPPQRHTVRFALVTILLTVAAVFATVSLNALAAGDAVRTARLQQDVAAAEARYAALVAEVARLEDPARIEAVATDELGMVPAQDAGFLLLDRPLPRDRRTPRTEVVEGDQTDPLKPVLSVER